MFVSHADPILPVDAPSLSGIKKLCHHCAIRECTFVIIKGFNIDEACSAIAEHVVIVIAMCVLDDDLIF